MKISKYICVAFFLFTVTFTEAQACTNGSLKSSTPASGQEISSAPENLELIFHNPVRLTDVALYDINGEQIKFAIMLSPRKSTRFEIPIPSIKPSSYRIKWSMIGTDGKKVDGQWSFTYKAP